MIRAILLFSKGLDSLLAGKIIQSQGIEVIPVSFITPFFNWKFYEQPELYYSYCKSQGFNECHLINITEEYLKIFYKPKYGFGSHANPCVACKIFMLSKAKALMKDLNANFLITGEVIGQRPKSQNRWAMNIIQNESGMDDLLLRPLSAKLLPPSLPERMGWVDRDKLFGIYGRNRKVQFFLAKEFGITNFETPAGGCLLTDPQIGSRILKILKDGRKFTTITAQLVVLGRHYFNGETWIVLGRNHFENKKIYKIAKSVLPLYTLSEPAPLAAIIQGNPSDIEIRDLLVSYSKKAKEKIKFGEKVDLIVPDESEYLD